MHFILELVEMATRSEIAIDAQPEIHLPCLRCLRNVMIKEDEKRKQIVHTEKFEHPAYI